MSKVTLSVSPPRGQVEFDFLKVVQAEVEKFWANCGLSAVELERRISLKWYDDAPVSAGVAVTITFSDLEMFDLIAELQTFLRKMRHDVSVILGY